MLHMFGGPDFEQHDAKGTGAPAAWDDVGLVGHDGDPVQGRLPVEEHNVAINEVPLHQIANLKGI